METLKRIQARLTPKKQKKKEKKKYNIIPQQDDLIHELNASYKSKVKERIRLPLIEFVKWHNNRGTTEWLSSLTAADDIHSVVSFLFYGKETMPILLKAIGPIQLDVISSAANDNDCEAVVPLPGFLLFKDKLADAPIEIENKNEFKSLLLEAIKSSINTYERHPVADFLFETNKRLGKIGWLFNLGPKKTKNRTYRDKFLATALYNILGGGCNLEHCDILATALGSKSTSAEKKKDWIKSIAREFVHEVIDDIRVNGEMNSTARTAPTTTSTITSPSTMLTSPSTMLTSTTAPSTLVATATAISLNGAQSKQLSSLITNVDCDQMMMISPLKSPTLTTTTVIATSALESESDPASTLASESELASSLALALALESNSEPASTVASTAAAAAVAGPIQYKTPSKGLSNTTSTMITTPFISTNTTLETPTADISFDSHEDDDCAPVSLLFGLPEDNTDSPAVLSTQQQKLSRPPPSPFLTSPLPKQKKKKAKRLPFLEVISPRMSVENFRRQLENKTTDEARIAAIDFLFETETANTKSVGKLLDSLANKSKMMEKKVTSGSIDYISNKANSNNGYVTKRNTLLISVKKPRSINDDTEDRYRQRYIAQKADELDNVIRIMLGNELGKEVLSHSLTSKYDLVACEKIDSIITEMEMLAVSSQAGFKVATSVTGSITKNLVRLLKQKKALVCDKPIVGQLIKKMGQLERNGTVPIEIEQVECYVTKTDAKAVVFYYIANVPLLMERLVAGCILDGKYEDSFEISKFNGKVIFKIGADRGGSDLINEIGLVNRFKGNSGRYSIPIGVVEGATEIHSNMVQTIYSPVRKQILEQLVNQHLWMVRIFFYHTDSSTVQEVKCCILRLEGIERKRLSETKFVCTIDRRMSNAVAETGWKSNANDRSIADTAFVTVDMFLSNTEGDAISFNMNIQLVISNGQYVGCKMIAVKTTEEIFSFKFDNGVDIDENCLRNIRGDCLQLIGSVIEDGKMVTTSNGLSTCGASYPCPCCLWSLHDKRLPSWMKTYGDEPKPDGYIFTYTDYETRTGDYSLATSYKNFEKQRGSDKGPIPIEIKKSVYSVILKPLLNIDDDLLWVTPVDGMHISQGTMTHLTLECSTQLTYCGSVDDGFTSKLIQQVQEQIDTMESSAKEDEDYLDAKKEYDKEKKLAHDAYNRYMKSIKEGKDDRTTIEEYYTAFIEASKRKDDIGNENGYISMMKEIHGGIELKEMMVKFNKNKKKHLNKAVFVFMKALKTYAGDFTKGHGVYELSNAMGIRALENRQHIYDTVINGCVDDNAVKKVMDWWLDCAGTLFQISVILKSQSKLDPPDIEALKHLIANYVYKWMPQLEKYCTKNPIFWKLHMLCCPFIRFLMMTGMTGRCSAEGFENKHYHMRLLKTLMAPIAQDKMRCEKLSQRQQACLIPGFNEANNFFENADTEASRGKRGRYKSYGTRTKLMQDVPTQAAGTSNDNVDADVLDDYFVSAEGNYIPNTLKDFYYYMLLGRVPDDWSQAFRDSSSMGTMAASAAGNVPI